MSTRSSSAWDRLPMPDGDPIPAGIPRPSTVRAARAAERIAPFEAAAEGRGTPKAGLGPEYLARIHAVRDRASAPVRGSQTLIRLLRVGARVPSGGAEAAVAIIVTIAIIESDGTARWVLGVMLLALGAAVAWRVQSRDRLKPAIAALDARHCPDCGYSLDGIPPGLDPGETGGVDVGPRACPECGSPWPLVPPPAPHPQL